MRRVWTEDEINLLKKLHPSMPNNEIARRLDRPRYSIENKAKKLGLIKSPEFKRKMYEKLVEMGLEAKMKKGLMKLWTTKEDERLTQLCGKSFLSEIARQMGRSRSSVKDRLRKLGLSCNNPARFSGLEGEKMAGSFFERSGWKIVRKGCGNKPFDFIVQINGETYVLDVKHGSLSISRYSTFERFMAVSRGDKHAFLYITPDKKIFFIPIEEIGRVN